MDILNAIVALLNFVVIPGTAYGAQLALGALGVTLIYGILRFSNFAHGDTMAALLADPEVRRSFLGGVDGLIEHPYRVALLAATTVLVLSAAVSAAEQRNCDTDMAIFPNANYEDASFRMTITATDKEAIVRVHKSGTWVARRTRHESGADTVVFNTGAAIETLTIGVGGELLWEIDYMDAASSGDRVIAFAGQCQPWRPK